MNLKRLKHELTYIFDDTPPPFNGSLLELIDDVMKHPLPDGIKSSLSLLRDRCEILIFEKQQLENAVSDLKNTLSSLDGVRVS